jgi:nuclear pore complex protein Nup133
MVFVARTQTRLYRLTVTARPGTGKFIVVPLPFSDQENPTTSWLSPFRMLQRKTSVWDSGDIITVISSFTNQAFPFTKNALARGSDDRPLWVLTSKNLMKWNLNLEGGEMVVSCL